eukprot:318468_1
MRSFIVALRSVPNIIPVSVSKIKPSCTNCHDRNPISEIISITITNPLDDTVIDVPVTNYIIRDSPANRNRIVGGGHPNAANTNNVFDCDDYNNNIGGHPNAANTNNVFDCDDYNNDSVMYDLEEDNIEFFQYLLHLV